MGDTYALWLLIRDVYDFDMETFEGRLRLQKTVYLLQSFGIDLGYYFTWYLRGPYSPELTRDGFKLVDEKKSMVDIPLKFRKSATRDKFDNFKKFLAYKKKNADMLEIAASICYRRNVEGKEKENVLKLTENKMKRFDLEDCKRLWSELESMGIIKN